MSKGIPIIVFTGLLVGFFRHARNAKSHASGPSLNGRETGELAPLFGKVGV